MLDLSLDLKTALGDSKQMALKDIPQEASFSLKATFSQNIPGFKSGTSLSVGFTIFHDNQLNRPRQLHFEEKQYSQLLYSISGEMDIDLIFNLFGLKLDGKYSLLFASPHPKNSILDECVNKDLSSFPVFLNQEDLINLPEHQVLSFTIDRGAELTMDFSWSNVLTRSISGISGLGIDPKTLVLDIKPSLSLAFKYAISDSQMLLAKKSQMGHLELALTRADQIQKVANAGVKVSLNFSDNKHFEELLQDTGNKVIEAILGTKLSQLNNFLKDSNQKKENLKKQVWYPIFGKLVDLDKLEIPDIRKELEKVKDNIITKIQSAIHKNTELALRYEYRKVESQSELLHFQLPAPKVPDYHSSLVNLKLGKILEDFKTNKLSQDLFFHYLNQNTLTVKRSLGLGLTLFDKNLFSVSGKKSFHKTVSQNLVGQKSIHYQIGSGYMGELGNWSSEWFSENTCAMEGFSISPRFNDATFGQYLSQSSGGRIRNIADLENHLDTGVIWGSIMPEERAELAKTHFETLRNKVIEVQNTILIAGEGYFSFLSQLATLIKRNPAHLNGILAESLASALPYLPEIEFRRDISKRSQAYKMAFVHLLQHASPSDHAMTNAIAQNILEIGPINKENQAHADMEKRKLPGMFLEILSQNRDIKQKWTRIGTFYERFFDALSNNLEIEGNFEKLEKDLREIPSASLHSRALGALMHYFAKNNPSISSHTIRSTEIIVAGEKNIVLSVI
ncbi:hypothetical protein [Arthrospiribacter ruber]|uniref:Uncharacterized protein n=1 Tax=Arthrospiribacter ruber TaxID=2487934 RepID=A0A951J214_9BACT|nr:hypothetical protein [Arthrospiribacter ruber]MBW3469508.1 hypothetical protein [Arthrospiribacter ruber]